MKSSGLVRTSWATLGQYSSILPLRMLRQRQLLTPSIGRATAHRYKLREKLARWGSSIAIHGDLVPIKKPGHADSWDFYVYGAQNLVSGRNFPPQEVVLLAANLSLRHVPILGQAKLGDLATSVFEMVWMVEGSILNGRERKGSVFTSEDGSTSFKVISAAYLLERERLRDGR